MTSFVLGPKTELAARGPVSSNPGFAFIEMEAELSRIIGRKVDLNMGGFLSPYIRDQVLREAEVQYVAA